MKSLSARSRQSLNAILHEQDGPYHLGAFAGTVGYFLLAFSLSRQIAVAELTARPEVENWADPNKLSATPFFSAGVCAAALFLLTYLLINWRIAGHS